MPIDASLILLVLAASLGAYLVIGLLRATKPRPPDRLIGLVHGAIGAVGMLELVVGVGHLHGLQKRGLAGFGGTAEILTGLAILLGLLVVNWSWQGRRPPGLVVAVHASVAITAIAVVMALAQIPL